MAEALMNRVFLWHGGSLAKASAKCLNGQIRLNEDCCIDESKTEFLRQVERELTGSGEKTVEAGIEDTRLNEINNQTSAGY